MVHTLVFPEATTEKAAIQAREEKVLKDVEAKLKKSKEFGEIEKKLQDTNLKGNQTKVTHFLKLEKGEEALAAAKINDAVKKTEKEVVVAARKKVKKALASAKLDEKGESSCSREKDRGRSCNDS